MDVWVIESDTWKEDQFIWGVAESIAAAVDFIKRQYGTPYVVQWQHPKKLHDEPECWALTGDFTGIEGYCGSGPQSYLLTKYSVEQKASVDGGKTGVEQSHT